MKKPEVKKHKVKIWTNPLGVEQPCTSEQIAAHFQISMRTLSSWRSGENESQIRIPFMKINARNFRYRLSDVEKALAK